MLALGWLAVLAGAAGPAAADVFRAGELRLAPAAGDAGRYTLTARLPVEAAVRDGLVWPAGCRQLDVRQQPVGAALQLSYLVACDAPLAADALIVTPWRLDGASFTSALGAEPSTVTLRGGADARLSLPVAGAAAVVMRAPLAVVGEFLWQGMLHIWFGWDHLAFVLCLCLITGGPALFWLITTFTLGHSLSLGFAFLGVVAVPIPPVEAVIALSIVFLAREGLLQRRSRDAARPRDFVVVAAFGLVHGLGFASALGELGVAPGERLLALAAFNVGVEAGQVVFVGALLGLLAGLGRLASGAVPVLRGASLYAAGGVGAFWMLERIAGF